MSGPLGDVQRYLDAAPEPGRRAYLEVRQMVARHAPTAGETLSYDMPTFVLDGRRLFHVAAWAKHLSIYPVPDDAALARDLLPYLSGASTLKFLYRNDFPSELVERVVAAHVTRAERDAAT